MNKISVFLQKQKYVNKRPLGTLSISQSTEQSLGGSSRKSYLLNMGPVHPSLHGVLRLITELEGERIIQVDPHIGLLHRGTEKLMEHKTYLQALPYMDRLDYVSMMAQEHTYCMAVENLLNIKVDKTSQAIRVLFLEITRILNHLLAITTHAMDVGALTPFLWAFEEREKLMSFYEKVSGARLHASYIRIGGLANNLFRINDKNNESVGILEEIGLFALQFPSRIDELEELLSENRIWMGRTMNVGVISKEQALENSFSGPLIRASQIPWDLRKTTPYEIYDKLNFNVIIGNYGDSYDRYKVRIEEMRESCKIITQVTNLLFESLSYKKEYQLANEHSGFIANGHKKYIKSKKASMEAIINHFKFYSKGFMVPRGVSFVATEAPKGEFGIFLVSDDSEKIYRCSIKTPGFVHLRAIDLMSKGCFIADLITNLGTLDIVLGEVDR